MLCPRCRRQRARRDAFCPSCGASWDGSVGTLDLVLPDGTRVPLAGEVTIGRGAESTLRIEDRTVSRRHARVRAGGPAPVLEDAGSSHGTFLDGRRVAEGTPLADGATITVGDIELRVERRRAEAEAGRTVVVPAHASVVVGSVGPAEVRQAGTQAGFRPRMRPGWKLKRLAEGEAALRYVLSSEHMPGLLRMGPDDAAMVQMLDGEHPLPELMAESERRHGPAGVGRLARLLADLGERGLLEDVDAPERHEREGFVGRLVRPRERSWTGVGPFFERLYRRGGYLAFTRPGVVLLAAVALAGLGAFVALIVGRGGTPFVVASRVGIGALVFLAGRFAVVAVHEVAHGLAMASFGRTVPRGGVKAIIGVPFVFVDTTEAWFETRRRRLAISAAGPASDLVIGGAASLAALAMSPGNLRDIVYQVAFAAYVGAFYNLNPFLDRDGYHMLVDGLGEPGLRRRARERLARRLAGKPVPDDGSSRGLAIYGVASVGWLLAAAGFVIVLTIMYEDRMEAIAPPEVVWSVLGALYVLLFAPVAFVVGKPLRERRRMRGQAVADVVG